MVSDRSKVIVGGTMIRAYVLIQTRVGMGPRVRLDVAGITGVITSEGVTGPFDVIASA